MGSSMETGEVWALCGWFFVLGGSMAFGALFGMAIFDFIKQVFNNSH
jgi:hypothetical protein